MKSDYLLVKTDVLPDVFSKVAQAKYLLSTGKAKNLSEAARVCGFSRSAFYKYRNSVFYANEQGVENIINISAVLENRAGVLSNFIGVLCANGANILTINQGMPSMGVASVTVSYKREGGEKSNDEILQNLMNVDGVVSAGRVLGEI